jgi:hypothetical protein
VELAHDENAHLTERVLLARRTELAPYFIAYPVQAEYRDSRTLLVDPHTLELFQEPGPGATWLLPLTPGQ